MNFGTFSQIENDEHVMRPRIHGLVYKLSRKQPCTYEDIVDVARRLMKWHPPKGNFRNGLQVYIDLMDEITRLRSLYPELRTLAGQIEIALSRMYADAIPLEDGSDIVLHSSTRVIEEEIQSRQRFEERVRLENMLSHIKLLQPGYSGRWRALSVIRSMFPGEYPWKLPLEELDSAQESADHIAQKLIKHRQYGVKPCVMQDGFLHSPKDAWVFLDGFDELSDQDQDQSPFIRLPLAISHLAERRLVKSLRTNVERDFDTHFQMRRLAYPSKMMVVCQLDGSLTLDCEFGVRPIEAAFAEAGRAEVYQYFRMVHLLRLSDLILPAEVYHRLKVPAWPTMPERRQDRDARQERMPELLRELRIPRIRVLENPQLIDAALEAEMNEEEDAHDTHPAKARGRHWVPGFRRPLPEGCSATPQAHLLAWQQRQIILSPGETYVRNHHRGKGDDAIIGHEAKRRPSPS